MGTSIVVASGKGGTGKTSSVGAIASFLAAAGYKTLCLDCDIGLRNLDLTLGLSDISFTDFGDVLSGSMPLEVAAVEHPDIENLYLLSAPSALPEGGITYPQMAAFMEQIRNSFDYCLIDSPAGIGSGFRLAASCADSAIVVVTGDISSCRGGQRVAMELEKIGISSIRLLVNRIQPDWLEWSKMTVDSIIDMVGVRLLGLVREDPDVALAANLETPLILYKTGGAAANFRRIAGRVAGKNIPLKRI